MEGKVLYWLDGKLMGERTKEEIEEIIKLAKTSGYSIHRRPEPNLEHVFVYTAGEGEGANSI